MRNNYSKIDGVIESPERVLRQLQNQFTSDFSPRGKTLEHQGALSDRLMFHEYESGTLLSNLTSGSALHRRVNQIEEVDLTLADYGHLMLGETLKMPETTGSIAEPEVVVVAPAVSRLSIPKLDLKPQTVAIEMSANDAINRATSRLEKRIEERRQELLGDAPLASLVSKSLSARGLGDRGRLEKSLEVVRCMRREAQKQKEKKQKREQELLQTLLKPPTFESDGKHPQHLRNSKNERSSKRKPEILLPSAEKDVNGHECVLKRRYRRSDIFVQQALESGAAGDEDQPITARTTNNDSITQLQKGIGEKDGDFFHRQVRKLLCETSPLNKHSEGFFGRKSQSDDTKEEMEASPPVTVARNSQSVRSSKIERQSHGRQNVLMHQRQACMQAQRAFLTSFVALQFLSQVHRIQQDHFDDIRSLQIVPRIEHAWICHRARQKHRRWNETVTPWSTLTLLFAASMLRAKLSRLRRRRHAAGVVIELLRAACHISLYRGCARVMGAVKRIQRSFRRRLEVDNLRVQLLEEVWVAREWKLVEQNRKTLLKAVAGAPDTIVERTAAQVEFARGTDKERVPSWMQTDNVLFHATINHQNSQSNANTGGTVRVLAINRQSTITSRPSSPHANSNPSRAEKLNNAAKDGESLNREADQVEPSKVPDQINVSLLLTPLFWRR